MIVVSFLRGVAAIGSAPHQLASHIRRLVAVVSLLLQHIGEEEEFQHKEDDKQLDEDDSPISIFMVRNLCVLPSDASRDALW